MIEVASVNPFLLPSVPLAQKKLLPECMGIYFAIDTNDKVHYIGQSCNLRARWANHQKASVLKSMGEIRVAWLEVSSKSLLLEMEAALISYFNPIVNDRKNTRQKKRSAANIPFQFQTVNNCASLKTSSYGQKFSLRNYWIAPEIEEKLQAFSDASGQSRQNLISEFTIEWLETNLVYCIQSARLDLQKRDINPCMWAEIVLEKGFKKLPNYKSPILKDEFPNNPLASTILPSDVVQKTSNYFFLTGQNYLLLRTAIYFHQSSAAKFISKIIHGHLLQNWDSRYAGQIAAEKSNDWIKVRSKL